MPRPIRPRRTTRSSGKAQETQEEVVLPTLSRRKKRQVPVLPPITTQGPLYKTVAISDECSTSPARAVSARRIPIHDQDDILRRTETRNVILQNYDDAKVDCLDTRELLDLLQNCMAVFDLSPTDRIALFSKLTLIDATLANASMHTPPPTPIRNKQTQHKEKKKKRQKSKFPILESAAIPPSFANAFAAASVSHAGTEPTVPQDGLNRLETWIDRRFVEIATGCSVWGRTRPRRKLLLSSGLP